MSLLQVNSLNSSQYTFSTTNIRIMLKYPVLRMNSWYICTTYVYFTGQ